jgi:hypothetical protein
MYDLSNEHVLTDPHLAQIVRSVRPNENTKCTRERAIGATSKDG